MRVFTHLLQHANPIKWGDPAWSDNAYRSWIRCWPPHVPSGLGAEVTFEQSRAHLGVETQRQWSDTAIERTTPCLFGLYSIVAFLGQRLYPAGDRPFHQTAWYRKQQATFTDVLAAVRRHLWRHFSSSTSPENPNVILLSRSDLPRLADVVCSSAKNVQSPGILWLKSHSRPMSPR